MIALDGGIILGKDWENFETCDYGKENMIVIKESCNLFPKIDMIKIKEQEYLCRTSTGLMAVNKDGNEGIIFQKANEEELELMLMYIFNMHVIKKRMFFLHSSIVKTRKSGIMFLGPSGIGKTTQAELWKKYRDALIINGDVVLVQETPDAFLGWGTPWHGSSPYCENTSVPVAAMVVLKQAPKNSIRELTGFEKVTEVSNSVFYPQWVEGGMELCLETLDHLLTKIPVYELSCRPDEGAVELVEQVVFGHVQ